MRERSSHWHVLAGIAVAACAAVAARAPAQDRAPAIPLSQLGTVSQVIAGTRIEITYRRPVARGRALFGALVKWNQIWTPSADSAAIITLSAPVQVQGHTLPAGSYSIWAIPRPDSWTMIFNSVAHTFHLRYPDGHDVLRVAAVPVTGQYVETLTFAFPLADADSARLALHWGTTVVPLALRTAR